uniref:Uncharacterized protein n=1 Tax=Panagrolaimus davidi TaxID=227884 RepID=A0A914PHC9_9BILA
MIQKTVQEILKLSHLQNFGEFELFNVPEAFDVQAFFAFIKKSKCIMFQLEFANALSVACQTRLEAVVDEMIEAENLDYIPSWIYFPEIDVENARKLAKICHIYL